MNSTNSDDLTIFDLFKFTRAINIYKLAWIILGN